jgi:MYXO-CTERM domain-containing protein
MRRLPLGLAVGLTLTLPPLAATAQRVVPRDLVLNTVARGLNAPTAAAELPDGRLVIIQQNGGIRVRPAAGGALINAGTIAVDRGHPERGLLGLAVDPQFATSNRLYVYYSAPNSPTNDRNRVAWTTIDPQTSQVAVGNLNDIVVGLFGPANHNGGGIEFGPDGHLYIGVGDTGCNCSCRPGTANNWFPTCLTNGNGKILRVARDGSIPASNPLVGLNNVPACGANPRPSGSRTDGCNAPLYMSQQGAPRTDIFAWGFRNPWRFGFDPATGFLWVGDVGEVTWEEISIVRGGGEHHGWPFREGAEGDDPMTCNGATPQSTGPCVDPAYAYPHAGGAASVTGGTFTTHCRWPAPYAGRYWFADYDQDLRAVWTLTPNAARDGVVNNSRETILEDAAGVVHFFNFRDGGLGLVSINDGVVWRLDPANPATCPEPVDAGFAPDAAPPAPDAAVAADAAPAVDAQATPDAAPPADAQASGDAAPSPDATRAPDAQAAADAGTVGGADATSTDAGSTGEAKDGCSCSTSTVRGPGFELVAWVGLALGGLAFRRRQARH